MGHGETFKTEVKIDKPLCVTQESLLILESSIEKAKTYIDRCHKELEEKNSKEMESKSEKGHYINHEKTDYWCRVSIVADYGDRHVKYESISEIISDISKKDAPSSINVEITIMTNRHYSQRVVVTTNRSNLGFAELTVEEGALDNKKLFEFFSPWIESITPSKKIKTWRLLGEFAWLFPFVVALGAISIATKKIRTPNEFGLRINELVENGVNSANIHEAVEVLLKLNTGVSAVTTEITYQMPNALIIIAVALFQLFLIAAPRGYYIAIKSNLPKYQRRLLVERFFTGTLPLSIAGLLYELLKDVFISR